MKTCPVGPCNPKPGGSWLRAPRAWGVAGLATPAAARRLWRRGGDRLRVGQQRRPDLDGGHRDGESGGNEHGAGINGGRDREPGG